MTEAESAPAAAAPAAKKKTFLGRTGVLVTGGVVALVVALAAGFGLGYWTARPEHPRHHPRAWIAHAPMDRPGGPDRPFPGQPREDRRGPEFAAGATTAGTIAAINGDEWTVTQANTGSVKVRINGDTKFGSPQFVQERAQFAVGDHVVIRGKAENSALTAAGVIERPAPQPPR